MCVSDMVLKLLTELKPLHQLAVGRQHLLELAIVWATQKTPPLWQYGVGQWVCPVNARSVSSWFYIYPNALI